MAVPVAFLFIKDLNVNQYDCTTHGKLSYESWLTLLTQSIIDVESSVLAAWLLVCASPSARDLDRDLTAAALYLKEDAGPER